MEVKNNLFQSHPKGLFYLFFTEMWERFSYYGMRALLVLFIYSSVEKGGLGWTTMEALQVYGWYTMFVYLASIPGGIIADKFLGQKKTVFLGGVLLVIGHSILAIEGVVPFFTGLVFIVLGVGGLKPNISSMVGGLYPKGDERRDKGFTIFYMGINLGAVLSSIIVGYVGEEIGWHYGFGIAGIGMALGLFIYIMGQKHLKHVGNLLVVKKEKKGKKENMWGRFFRDRIAVFTSLAFFVLAFFILYQEHSINNILWFSIIVFLGIALGWGIVLYKELTAIEKDRVSVMLVAFLAIIFFWGAFEQAGGLMNIYAKEKTDRMFFSLFEIPASVFQSVNAFFIILLGIPIANFWIKMKKKNQESSSIFKMTIGIILMGFGFIFMAKSSMEADGEAFGKGLLIWLILAYLLHTIGELCASPVALSFVTKLAPVKYASLMMGIYFAATGMGNKLAGKIGEFSQIKNTDIYVTQIEKLKQTLGEIDVEAEKLEIKANLYLEEEQLVLKEVKSQIHLSSFIHFSPSVDQEAMKKSLVTTSAQTPYHTIISIPIKKENEPSIMAEMSILEVQNKREFTVFISIVIFTTCFGLLLLLFFKKLKRMTHNAE